MLNHKYKILFIGSNRLTFIVFEIIENKITVFFNFSQQYVFLNFMHQIMELFAKAAIFLNEKIDEIKIIFDEPNISKINFTNTKINNCHSIEEVKKMIIMTLNNENCYVNEIAIKNLISNDNGIICDYVAFVTKWEKYKYYVDAIKQCRIKVTYVRNIYSLLFNQNETNESFFKIIEQQIIVGKYENTKLTDIKTTTFDFEYIHTKIAKIFHLPIDKVKTMLVLLDKIIVNVNEDVKIAANFIPTTSLNFIRASTLLNEFNFYFTKELNRCFGMLNFTSHNEKYFVETDQYNNLIKFLTRYNFFSHQKNFDFTWLTNLTITQKIAVNNIIKIDEKQSHMVKKFIPKNGFIFPYFLEK